MQIKLIVEHIRTPAGARFSVYKNDEDRRVQLIQYFNEVHADGAADELDEEGTSLDDVLEAIEECEDVSCEEIWVDEPVIDVIAKVFSDAKDAPTSFEPEEWLEGFEDGRQIIAERIALELQIVPGFDELAFRKACDLTLDEGE